MHGGTCEWDGVRFARCSGRDWHLGAEDGNGEGEPERKANGRERDIGGNEGEKSKWRLEREGEE